MYVDSNVFFDRIVQAACKFDVRALNQFASTVSIDILSLVQISKCPVLISPAGYLAATGRHKEVELLRKYYHASSMYISFGVGISKDGEYLQKLKSLNFLDIEFATQGLALAGISPEEIRIYLDTLELDKQRLMIGYANGGHQGHLKCLYESENWQHKAFYQVLQQVLIGLEMSQSCDYIQFLKSEHPEVSQYLGYGIGIVGHAIPESLLYDVSYKINHAKGVLLSGRVSNLDVILTTSGLNEADASERVSSNGNLVALKLMLRQYPDLSRSTISNAGYRFSHITDLASTVSWFCALCTTEAHAINFWEGLKDKADILDSSRRASQVRKLYKAGGKILRAPLFEYSAFSSNVDQCAQFLALRLSIPGNYSVYYSESDKQYYLPPELWERVLYFLSNTLLSPEYIRRLYFEYSRLCFPVSSQKLSLSISGSECER